MKPNTALLSDLESDLRHLYHLLDTICDTAFGAGGHAERERCDALLWIAREHADKVRKDAHAALSGDVA